MSEPAREEWPIWGSLAVLCVASPERCGAARAAVDNVLEAVGNACNRFDPNSELSKVNALSGRRVRVSALFADLLAAAIDAAEVTQGAVDPTVGTSLEAAGYDRDIAAVEDSNERAAFTPAGGYQALEFNRSDRSVLVPRGVKLDLGSTGKAIAVDMAARAAAEAAGCGVLFSLGGDIAVAGQPPSGGWSVRVTDDHRASTSAPGQTVAVSSGGLATSSTLARRWRRGDALHHILEPTTGAPAREVWATVSVAAPSCLEANAYATAAIVRGSNACDRLSGLGLPARLRAHDGQVRYVAGWPTAGDSTCGPGI